MSNGTRLALLPALVCLVLVCAACAQPGGESPGTFRAVDHFGDAVVSGTPGATEAPTPTQWSFDSGELAGWTAGPGVGSLEISDGRLTGRTTTDVPILHVERAEGFDTNDVLHEIQIRARVSDGANLRVALSGREEPDLERMVERARIFPWSLSTPIVAGDDLQTYTITAASAARTSYPSADARHVLIQPSDAEGATFEIESVRLVFRKEHLTSIPSGVSWQGLSEVYRETIVTRAPETTTLPLTLPAEPLLDLAVGTVEQVPVTFRVTIDGEPLVERTVTMADRWEEITLPLDGRGGETVELGLSLESTQEGAIGFWGAPAVRSRAALAEGAPRGVILVLLDTLRRDHLESYGYERPTAPNTARLAEEGTLFLDAIAQGAWTKVSVPSMLSSTYPTSNGIWEIWHKLPASADTIAEAFREAGYATWAASGNGFSGRSTNLHQGLEVFHESSSLNPPEGFPGAKSARMLADRLLPWLEAHRDVPFFVFYHALDPHSPYEPYSPYDTMWAEPGGKAAHEARVEAVRPFIQSDFMKPMGLPTRSELIEAGVDPDEFVAHELDWYDGAIRGADAEIGRIMERLAQLGLEEDTLVVFFSDHGEEFLDHGGHFHEENVYGEMVNVPLILHWPGVVPAGLVVEETVQMLDMVPTVLELAGIPVSERMQGVSLVPLLDGSGSWSERPAISEWNRRTDQRDQDIVDAFSVIEDGYKLVHNYARPEGVPEFELYDHRNDPLDLIDIAADHPEIVERLRTRLDGWLEWAQANTLPSDAESMEGLDAEELERLRSLGYVQ